MKAIKCALNCGKMARTHVKCVHCGNVFDIPIDVDWMWTTEDSRPLCNDCGELFK